MSAAAGKGLLSSLAMVMAIAVVILAQAAFTFAAILESERLTRLTSARDATARDYRALERTLYREYSASGSARASVSAEVHTRIAALRRALPAAHSPELLQIEAYASAYERAAARGASPAETDALYTRLRGFVLESIEAFERRTAQLDAEGLDAQKRLREIAGAVLLAGLILIAALLAVLEFYRRNAERAAKLRVEFLNAALHTDALTGLANDRAFHERLAQLAALHREGACPALLMLDVDDFKSVNDARGRDHGDVLLRKLASALKHGPNGIQVYRLAGDRFAVLWPDRNGRPRRGAADRLHAVASQALGGITLSAGFGECDPDHSDVDLVECVKAALRTAKRKGGNTVVDFRDVEAGVFIFSPAKAEGVRQMLNAASMPVVFQAIVDAQTGRAIAHEALARPAGEYGLSGPDEMFDVAERLYKTFELDKLCVSSALRQVAERQPNGMVFLNVVPASLESERLDIDGCVEEMAAVGISPGDVVFELTERKISNPSLLTARIDRLRQYGFRVALDDTGSGYAGLDVLSKMTFDFVKIDRSLLMRAMNDERARGVLSGVLAIAQETGSTVIAEGIETHDMFVFARRFQARSVSTPIGAMQGYLFGMPAAHPDAAGP